MRKVAVILLLLTSISLIATAQNGSSNPTLVNSEARDTGDAPAPPVLRKPAPTPTPLVETPKPPTVEAENAEVEENDVVRVSTSLITVPAEVLDRSGRNVANLRKEDFRLYENGVEQQLSYFGSTEQPFTLALLLDVSGSTQARLQAIRQAANAFISRLRPNDQLLIVSFDGKVNVLTEAVKLPELRRQSYGWTR